MSAPSGEEALAALIRATVAHQLRRPTLAWLLDFEEARQPQDAGLQHVAGHFLSLVSGTLARLDLPPRTDPDTAARDVMAIIKGMIDAAGQHGESDRGDLAARVGRAVFGYLGGGPRGVRGSISRVRGGSPQRVQGRAPGTGPASRPS